MPLLGWKAKTKATMNGTEQLLNWRGQMTAVRASLQPANVKGARSQHLLSVLDQAFFRKHRKRSIHLS
jgi:hypothetical protein